MLEIISYQIAALTLLVAFMLFLREEAVAKIFAVGAILLTLMLVAMTREQSNYVSTLINPEPIDYNLMSVE